MAVNSFNFSTTTTTTTATVISNSINEGVEKTLLITIISNVVLQIIARVKNVKQKKES